MTGRDNFQDVGRDSSEQSDRAHKTDREVGGVANRLLADKPNQVNSLAALIAQVQALDVRRLDAHLEDAEWDSMAEAAPVLAAALKDALETMEKIAREDPDTDDGRLARSFLERHKEETQ